MKVGIAGLGFMGMVHYLTYKKTPGVEVVAVCDVKAERLDGDWTDVQGNFGPKGEHVDLSGVRCYDSLDNLLADTGVDLVDLTLPPSLHADAAVAALHAGKHVFCEKPMSLHPTDCGRMEEAASDSDRMLQIGHVLPYFPEYEWAYQAATSGRYGELRGGAFRRVISDPSWLGDYWNPGLVGGPMYDLHIHDAHFVRLLFGMPNQVVSRGRLRGEVAEHWHSLFTCDDDCVVEVTSGTTDQQSRAFDHGFELHFDSATLLFEFAVIDGEGTYLCPPTALTEAGAERVALGDGDPMIAFERELNAMLTGLRSGVAADPLSPAFASDAVRICDMQRESLVGSSGVFA